MLGIFKIEGFLKLMDMVEAMGVDAMSTGVTLAWATEAYEKGLISADETLGLEFRWGDHNTYINAVELTARTKNDFYKALAKGVKHASSRYGGEDFALSFGSNEMAGYHTGPMCYAGYITGSRHSHLDSAGYSLDQKILREGKVPDPEESAEELLREEAWRQILSSLVVCFFSRGIYDGETVSEALETTGVEPRLDFNHLGLKILRKKAEFKSREGFKPEINRLPRRIFETASPSGKIDEEYLGKAVEHYYKLLIHGG